MKTVVSMMIDAHRLPGGLPAFVETTGCTMVDVDELMHLVKVSRPSTLVTPKVMNLLREAGITTFQWEPIFVDE